MNLFQLKEKLAVITGGNGGIGLGMARGIASCGATIVIAGRDEHKATAALRTLHEMGADASFIVADVTKKADREALIAGAVQAHGHVDILVNNAGTSIRKMPQDLSEDEWHHVLDTNLTSAFLCSQAAYPEMLKAGGGKMINVGSMMSLFGAPYAVAYLQQGRHRADVTSDGDGMGEGQHPGQRGAARLDRHRTDETSPATGAGPAR
jgi:2-deoxy-D-gluconate 3-dehydrogenase